jgi:two-component system sensor histidine kinase UhpB
MQNPVPLDTAAMPRRHAGLKFTLMLRVAGVATACFLMTAAYVLAEINRDARQNVEHLGMLLARQLDLQQIWAESGLGNPHLAPGWDAIAENVAANGECMRIYGPQGERTWSHCAGRQDQGKTVPQWFAGLYHLAFDPARPFERAISYRGQDRGKAVVEPDPAGVIFSAWRETVRLLTLTALTTVPLCLLVYAAIGHALRPTRVILAGLNRFGGGDLAYRLPAFKLNELQRISEAFNHLADRLAKTLTERTELAKRLIDAREEEQRSLARELHDEFAQNLAAINAIAASIRASSGEPAVRAESESLSQIAMGMMKALRGTLLRLRPADVDDVGLVESLKRLIAGWNQRAGTQTRFELETHGCAGCVPQETAIHVFRIAQEGLTNAARHAGAANVRLRLAPAGAGMPDAVTAGGLELVIEDDGNGDAAGGPENSGGMGLTGMRERVHALGGCISFDSRPGAGLTVRVAIPIACGPAPHGEARAP